VDPNAWIVVAPATEEERTVPLAGRLLVPADLRAERTAEADFATAPRSGPPAVRVERGEPIPLRDGDRIELGDHQLVFRLRHPDEAIVDEDRMTMFDVKVVPMAIVVADVVGYTTLTELHGGAEVAAVSDDLFDAVRRLLPGHGGTVVNYIGDAILAAWDMDRDLEAARHAVTFALAGSELAAERAASLPLRGPNDEPLRLGWAVTLGESASGRPSPTRQTVHGDAVLVTEEAAAAAPGAAHYGEPLELQVKGRTAPARVVSAVKG